MQSAQSAEIFFGLGEVAHFELEVGFLVGEGVGHGVEHERFGYVLEGVGGFFEHHVYAAAERVFLDQKLGVGLGGELDGVVDVGEGSGVLVVAVIKSGPSEEHSVIGGIGFELVVIDVEDGVVDFSLLIGLGRRVGGCADGDGR